jgi:hypothetical protein
MYNRVQSLLSESKSLRQISREPGSPYSNDKTTGTSYYRQAALPSGNQITCSKPELT